MNGVIVLFAVMAMLVIAIGLIGALRRRAANGSADLCGGAKAKDESILLL
jgi:hypothetical protein